MIERRHDAAGRRSRALYSDCGTYRYLLQRDWGDGADGGRLLYVLLNPSTADELRNDPTIERCKRRAQALGFPGFAVVNLFAFRATDPAELKRAAAPVGPENDGVLLAAAQGAALVLCGWGVHGAHRGRGPEVAAALRDRGLALCHLGLTRDGHPRHPLYLGYAVEPRAWV